MMRVVDDKDAPACAIEHEMRAACDAAVAEGALVSLLIWQTPDGSIGWRAMPAAGAVLVGLMECMNQALDGVGNGDV